MIGRDAAKTVQGRDGRQTALLHEQPRGPVRAGAGRAAAEQEKRPPALFVV